MTTFDKIEKALEAMINPKLKISVMDARTAAGLSDMADLALKELDRLKAALEAAVDGKP